jgi:hypothetical protein
MVISPSVEGVGLLDWRSIARMRELGRRAAEETLDAEPELARRLMH